jgi:hypothetical protein
MSYSVDTILTGPRGSLDTLPAPCSGIRWHVFHSRGAYERQADLALRRLGLETYLPLMIERWHGADRHEVVCTTGYTLARFDVNEVEWGRDAVLRQGCGDAGRFLLSPATRMPASIPDAAVDALRGQCEATFVEPRQMLPDDHGRVLTGWAAQLSGICTRTSRDRVWLLLSVLGRDTPVEFRRGEVELVG